MKDKRDAIDFANEPVGQLFRRMFLPTLVSMLSIVVLNIADGAFIGHGAGSESLAAINIAAPIFNILAGIGIMFGIGCSVVASIHMSRGEQKAADINVTQALLGSVLLTITVSIVILSNLSGTCRLFGSSEQLIPLAGSYLKWIAIAEPLIMIDMVGKFLVRLDGSPRFAMICSVAASALNIFLDWLFIFPFGWGLEGAAIATSIAFSLSGIALLIYMLFFTRTIHLYRLRCSWKSVMLTLRNLGYQVRMGFSVMLGEVAVSGAVIVGNYVFIHYQGEDGVAAYSVACYCFPCIFMVANAIVQAAQPIISFAHGAGNQERLKASYSLIMRWALVAGVLLSAAMYFGAPLVTATFLDRTEPAYGLCAEGLPYFGLGVLFATVNIVIIGYLQSVERSTRATIYTLLRGFIVVIPCFILLPRMIGSMGMWLAIPVAELITLAIIMAAGRK